MTYEETISDIVRIVEAVGAAIMAVGGLIALGIYVWSVLRTDDRSAAYVQARRNIGRVILLGLEVLIIGDIIRTIVVEPTLEAVGVLGGIVVIRIVLSFALEVEIDGRWPWRQGQSTSSST